MHSQLRELKLWQEICSMQLAPNVKLKLDENNLMCFKVEISFKEQHDCMWHGGVYLFTFRVGYDYPTVPPKVKCNTLVYHPNFGMDGQVSLKVLDEKEWT